MAALHPAVASAADAEGDEFNLIVGRETCTLLSQGAEARLWSTTFCGRPAVAKQRIRKRYRHPDLDARLTATRLRAEARAMARARRLGVPSPALFMVELPAATLYMERVDGHSLKALLSGGALGLPDVGEDAAVTAAAEEARDAVVAAAGGGAASALAAQRQGGNGVAGAGAAAPPLVPAPQHPAAAAAAAAASAASAVATTAAATTTAATTTATPAPAIAERATLALMRELGRVVARLHDGGLVHGDLTTSNVLVRGTFAWLDDKGRAKDGQSGGLAALEEALAERADERTAAAAAAAGGGGAAAAATATARGSGGGGPNKAQAHATAANLASAPVFAHPPPVVLIDYGLASNSTLPEDKAVDLYVLERALGSAHPRASRRLFDAVLQGYRGASSQWSATWNRFADVRQRGRKRTMVG